VLGDERRFEMLLLSSTESGPRERRPSRELQIFSDAPDSLRKLCAPRRARKL